jgi:hypothetical protein
MLTTNDLMFWIEGMATAPATFTPIVAEAVAALNRRSGRMRLGAIYLRCEHTSRMLSDESGARVFRWLAGLMAYSIRTDKPHG